MTRNALSLLLVALFVMSSAFGCSPKDSKSTAIDAKAEVGQNIKAADSAKDSAEQKDADVEKQDDVSALLEPAKLNEQAPDSYRVKFSTSKGDIVLELTRDWAPLGVDRFYNLVKNGFFSDIAIFRVVPGFVAQFGIHGKPLVSQLWRDSRFNDDPVKESNKRGTIVFATAGPNTRTTQLFINFVDNARLDQMGFAPIGKVVEGMDIVDAINAEYGESPDQGALQREGNSYLKKHYPNLDYILRAEIL
ncbi:MAG: peptidylprolyl isomerase [Bradymonadales bacterium]|jgi:peptidyl-prolyl cis-trans isomerase A (cyclophilin A)